MVCIIQSGNAVIDTVQIVKVTTNKEGGIYATCPGGIRETMAQYDDLRKAKFALEMYAKALSCDERLFVFPSNDDVKGRMNYTHDSPNRKFKSNSHGGT